MPTRAGPQYKLTFTPEATPDAWKEEAAVGGGGSRPKVCVLRQEGSNGDREMLSAFHAAGLEAWDVNMNDLLQGDSCCFRGLPLVRLFAFVYLFALFGVLVVRGSCLLVDWLTE